MILLLISRAKGVTISKIFDRINMKRKKNSTPAIGEDAVLRAAKGQTHRRGVIEARGRKRGWTVAQTRKTNEVRKTVIKKANGEREVHWDEIIAKARVPEVASSTAAMLRSPPRPAQARRTEECTYTRRLLPRSLGRPAQAWRNARTPDG